MNNKMSNNQTHMVCDLWRTGKTPLTAPSTFPSPLPDRTQCCLAHILPSAAAQSDTCTNKVGVCYYGWNIHTHKQMLPTGLALMHDTLSPNATPPGNDFCMAVIEHISWLDEKVSEPLPVYALCVCVWKIKCVCVCVGLCRYTNPLSSWLSAQYT